MEKILFQTETIVVQARNETTETAFSKHSGPKLENFEACSTAIMLTVNKNPDKSLPGE